MNDEIDDEILEAELKDDGLEKKMRKLESVPRHFVPGIPRISSISSANAG